jgi:hypothetical protein
MRRKRPDPTSGELSPAARRALASFLGGRLPAGQLHDELCRSTPAEVAGAAVAPPRSEAAQAA